MEEKPTDSKNKLTGTGTVDEFSVFMGQVTTALENQGKMIDEVRGNISSVKEDMSTMKGDVRLMRKEGELKRENCNNLFALHTEKIAEFEERFGRDYGRLNKIESVLKIDKAVIKAEEATTIKKRASVDYVIGLILLLFVIVNTVIAVQALKISQTAVKKEAAREQCEKENLNDN